MEVCAATTDRAAKAAKKLKTRCSRLLQPNLQPNQQNNDSSGQLGGCVLRGVRGGGSTVLEVCEGWELGGKGR